MKSRVKSELPTGVESVNDELIMLRSECKTSHDYMIGSLDKLNDWLYSEGHRDHVRLFKTIKSSLQKMIDAEKASLEGKFVSLDLDDELKQAEQKYTALEIQYKKQVEEMGRLKELLGFVKDAPKMVYPMPVFAPIAMMPPIGPLFPNPAMMLSAMSALSRSQLNSSIIADTENKSEVRSRDVSAKHSSDRVSSKERNPSNSQLTISSNEPMRSTSPVPGFGQPSTPKDESLLSGTNLEDEGDIDIEMMSKHQLWEMFGYALRWASAKNIMKEPIISITKVKNLYCACCQTKTTFYYHSNPKKSLRVMACYSCGYGVSKQVDDDSMDVDQFYKDFVVHALEAKKSTATNKTLGRR